MKTRSGWVTFAGIMLAQYGGAGYEDEPSPETVHAARRDSLS
jgi:hypothetical protein